MVKSLMCEYKMICHFEFLRQFFKIWHPDPIKFGRTNERLWEVAKFQDITLIIGYNALNTCLQWIIFLQIARTWVKAGPLIDGIFIDWSWGPSPHEGISEDRKNFMTHFLRLWPMTTTIERIYESINLARLCLMHHLFGHHRWSFFHITRVRGGGGSQRVLNTWIYDS